MTEKSPYICCPKTLQKMQLHKKSKEEHVYIPCRSCNQLEVFSKNMFLQICSTCWDRFSKLIEGNVVTRFLNGQPIGFDFKSGYFISEPGALFDEIKLNDTYACIISYNRHSTEESDLKIASLHKKLTNISFEETVGDQVNVVFNKQGNEDDSEILSFSDFIHYKLINLDQVKVAF